MFLKQRLYRGISEVYRLRHLGAAVSGWRVLLYHAVGSRLAHDPVGWSVDPTRFKQQMTSLEADKSWSAAPARALPAPGLRFSVTFDDGYRDNLTAAAPILADRGIPFTVFAVPKHIESKDALYLSLDELKRLAEVPGSTIGSHGYSHVHLTELSDSKLTMELADSRKWLENALGKPVETLAYPYGATNRRVRDAAEKAGYKLGFCSRTGINKSDRDPLLLCRTEILAGDDLKMFRLKLEGAFDWHQYRHSDPARK